MLGEKKLRHMNISVTETKCVKGNFSAQQLNSVLKFVVMAHVLALKMMNLFGGQRINVVVEKYTGGEDVNKR